MMASETSPKALGLAGGGLHHLRQVVDADHHVLGRSDDRPAVGRTEDVVGGQHQDPGFGLRLGRQWQVDRHLVAVEVGVESLADHRMDLDRLALDQHRLESLDAQTVKRRSPVQQHGMLLDHLGEDVPDLGTLALDHPLGRLDVLGEVAVDQALHHERLEELEGHDLGQTALVQLELGTDHDDRTSRVVDSLAEQVLAEPALLSLEHVRERLEGAVARPRHRPAAAAVVEQRVDGFLQHPLLVVDDDLGSPEVEQPLQPVVAVDDTAVEVVEVGRGEAAAVELDHRPQIGRDHRNRLEDQVAGAVLALPERTNDLQPLGGTLPLLGGIGHEVLLKEGHLGIEVEVVEKALDRLGPHAALEVALVAVGDRSPQLLGLDQGLGGHRPEAVVGVLDEVDLALGPLFALAHLLVDFTPPGRDLLALGAAFLHRAELDLEALQTRLLPLVELFLDHLALLAHGVFEFGEVLVALVGVDAGDQVGGEVDDLFQFLRRHVEQVAEPAGDALEEPDVSDRRGQFDVAHPLAADLGARHLDAAPFADDPLVADPLVLPAVALPVPLGTEDPLVEQTFLLRAEGAVVDRFRLLDLTVGPGANLVARGEADLQLIKNLSYQFTSPASSVWRLASGVSSNHSARGPRESVGVAFKISQPRAARDGKGRCRATRKDGTSPPPGLATRLPHRRPASRRSGKGSASP